MHTSTHARVHAYTLLVKQFQEARRKPTAGGCVPGLININLMEGFMIDLKTFLSLAISIKNAV